MMAVNQIVVKFAGWDVDFNTKIGTENITIAWKIDIQKFNAIVLMDKSRDIFCEVISA